MHKAFFKYILILYSLGMLLLSLLRVAFFLYYFNEASHENLSTILLSFAIGLFMDSNAIATALLLCYLLCLPLKLLTEKYTRLFQVLYLFSLSVITFTNMADIFYFKQYGTRMNNLAMEIMEHSSVVLPMLYKEFPLIKVVLLFMLLMFALYKLSVRYYHRMEVNKPHLFEFKWVASTLLTLGLLTFLYYGKPFWNITSFCGSALMNQMSSNGIYTYIKSIDQQRLFEKDLTSYADIDESIAINSVCNLSFHQSEKPIHQQFPTLRARAEQANAHPKNIVIIMVESFGAINIGCLNGKNNSPEFDRWAKQGILFNHCYANGTRTQNGLTSLLAGFPSVLGNSMIRRKGVNELSTIATILHRVGYQTQFIHNGDIGYDDMVNFLQQGGFETITDIKSFEQWRYKNNWGVCDEDLFDKAYPMIWANDKPKLSVLLTMSNHPPYEVPPYFLAQHPDLAKLKQSEGVFRYTDYCIGKFLDSCSRHPQFKNTLFLVIADHGEVYELRDHQYKLFHIPALLLNTNRPPQVFNSICSQVDFAPTLLFESGAAPSHHFIGQYLFDPDYKPFAISRHQQPMVYLHQGSRIMMMDVQRNVGGYYQTDQNGYINTPDSVQTGIEQTITFTKQYLQGLNVLFTKGKYQYR